MDKYPLRQCSHGFLADKCLICKAFNEQGKQMNKTPIKNPAAVALGKLNAGKPRRQSPELRAKRQQLMAQAREVLAHKRAQAKEIKP